ncbi:hypothetical protein B5M09_003914 [Aphanomyces astaci]|uniref:HECT domain-containing protein n=1 Tax=Aphanomyces astaci TaxID=112090 RepID=A0A425D332_APHAT|nr:hypothetical protein B5M09_003914 [Aphanomyces astaci]
MGAGHSKEVVVDKAGTSSSLMPCGRGVSPLPSSARRLDVRWGRIAMEQLFDDAFLSKQARRTGFLTSYPATSAASQRRLLLQTSDFQDPLRPSTATQGPLIPGSSDDDSDEDASLLAETIMALVDHDSPSLARYSITRLRDSLVRHCEVVDPFANKVNLQLFILSGMHDAMIARRSLPASCAATATQTGDKAAPSSPSSHEASLGVHVFLHLIHAMLATPDADKADVRQEFLMDLVPLLQQLAPLSLTPTTLISPQSAAKGTQPTPPDVVDTLQQFLLDACVSNDDSNGGGDIAMNALLRLAVARGAVSALLQAVQVLLGAPTTSTINGPDTCLDTTDSSDAVVKPSAPRHYVAKPPSSVAAAGIVKPTPGSVLLNRGDSGEDVVVVLKKKPKPPPSSVTAATSTPSSPPPLHHPSLVHPFAPNKNNCDSPKASIPPRHPSTTSRLFAAVDIRPVVAALSTIVPDVVSCRGKHDRNHTVAGNHDNGNDDDDDDADEDEREVWSCGQNSYGELSHGDTAPRKSFDRVEALQGKGIVHVCAGNEHTIAVSADGSVYTCGYNDNGQCGHGVTTRLPAMTELTKWPDASFERNVSQIHAYNGCEHTVVVAHDGSVASFGYNYRGQLGHGTTTSESLPKRIRGLDARRVTLVSCSYYHTMLSCAATMSSGGSVADVYSFGRNDYGQLGLNDTLDRRVPTLVDALSNIPLLALACGQYHSAVATADNKVLVCGKNDYGQLGLDGLENQLVPVAIGSGRLDNETVVDVRCGYYHTIVLCRRGRVFGFGRNDYGQLGIGDAGVHVNQRIATPTLLTDLEGKEVVRIACGCYHTVAVAESGMLYVFGRNNHGQLGTGDTTERLIPCAVDTFVGKRVAVVAAGFYHTVILTGGKDIEDEGTCVPELLPSHSDAIVADTASTCCEDDYVWTSSQAMLDELAKNKSRGMQRKSLSLDPTVDDEDDDCGDLPPMSPSSTSLAVLQLTSQVDAAVCVLAHLDRLCQPYIPRKGSYPALRQDKSKKIRDPHAMTRGGYHPYCVDMQAATFDALNYILQHFISPPIISSSPSSPPSTAAANALHDSHVYVVLAALRLVQANLAQLLKSGAGARIAVSDTGSTSSPHPLDAPLKRLHGVLVQWINEPSWLTQTDNQNSVRKAIEREAMEAMLLGLELFYPCPSSQIHLVVSMLKVVESAPSVVPCPSCHTHDVAVPKPRKTLVEPILRRMADDALLGQLFKNLPSNNNAIKRLLSMLLERVAGTTDDWLVLKGGPLPPSTNDGLRPYVVLLNAMQKQLASWAGDTQHPRMSPDDPGLYDVAAPQVDLPLSWRWFLEYATMVFQHATDNLHATAPLPTDAMRLDERLAALETSVVGSIVPSVVTTLLLFAHLVPFASKLLPSVTQVLRLVDGLNSYIPAAIQANLDLLGINTTAAADPAMPWCVTLERLLVQLAADMAATLVLGEPLHEYPAVLPSSSTTTVLFKWRHLLRGGLEPSTLTPCRIVPHDCSVEGSGRLPLPPNATVSHILMDAEFVALCDWVRSTHAARDASYRFVLKTSRRAFDEIEHAVYRVLIKHSNCDRDAALWSATAITTTAAATTRHAPPHVLAAPWGLVAECTRTLSQLKNSWQNQQGDDSSSVTSGVDRTSLFRQHVLRRCAFLLDIVVVPSTNRSTGGNNEADDEFTGVAVPSDPLPPPSHTSKQRQENSLHVHKPPPETSPFLARFPHSKWKRVRMLVHITVRWRRLLTQHDGTLSHHHLLRQIVTFVLDTDVNNVADVDDLRRELVRRCRRASSRARGLHTFGDLMTFTPHMSSMHTPVLNRLGRVLRIGLGGRLLTGLDGVGGFYGGRVLAACASVFSTVASMVATTHGGPRMLAALQCWGFVIEPDMYAFIDDVDIAAVLQQLSIKDGDDVAVRGATWAAFRYVVASGSAQHTSPEDRMTLLIPREPRWRHVMDALYAALSWSANAIIHENNGPRPNTDNGATTSSVVLGTTRSFAASDQSSSVTVSLASTFTVRFWLYVTKAPDAGTRCMVMSVSSHAKEWVPYCSLGEGASSTSTTRSTDVVLEVGLRQHSFQESLQHVVVCHQWLNIALVYDAATLHLFVHGEIVCAKAISSLHLVGASTPAKLTMGKPPVQLDTTWPFTGFDGWLAQVHVDENARSPMDVAADAALGPPNALMDRCCYQLGIVSLLLAHSSEGIAELTSSKWLALCFSLVDTTSFRIQQLTLRLLKRLLPYVDPSSIPHLFKGTQRANMPLIPYWMQCIGHAVLASTDPSHQKIHLALELSHVVMHLASVPKWTVSVQAALESGLDAAITCQRTSGATTTDVATAVGSLFVLGGGIEPLRVGAVVELSQGKEVGTVVSYHAPFAQLVLHKADKAAAAACPSYEEWVEVVHGSAADKNEFGKPVRVNTDELVVSWREYPPVPALSWSLLVATTMALLQNYGSNDDGNSDSSRMSWLSSSAATTTALIVQSSALKALVHGLRSAANLSNERMTWQHPELLPRLLALATQSDKSTVYCSVADMELKVAMVRQRLSDASIDRSGDNADDLGGIPATPHFKPGDEPSSHLKVAAAAFLRQDALPPSDIGDDCQGQDYDGDNGDDDDEDGGDDDDDDDDDEEEEARSEFVEELSLMGFPEDWCVLALKQTDNDMLSASAWIVDNLEYLNTLQAAKDKEDNSKQIVFNDEEDDDDDVGYHATPSSPPPPSSSSSSAVESSSSCCAAFCRDIPDRIVPCLTIVDAADIKETGRKVFGEMYFPFEEGGFLSNMPSLFLSLRLGNQPTPPGCTSTTTTCPPPSASLSSSADNLQQFAAELANTTDLRALATSVEQSLQIKYARQGLALYFAGMHHQANKLDETTERLLLQYAKAVLFRGPPASEDMTTPLEVVLASVVDAALTDNIGRMGGLVWATIVSELRQGCAPKYEGVLWTQRDVSTGDLSALSDPSVEFVVWLVQTFFAKPDRLRTYLATTQNEQSDKDFAGLDRNLLLVIARRRQLRERSQNRFYYSPYLQGLLELIRALPPPPLQDETPTGPSWGLQLVRASETSLTLAWPSPVVHSDQSRPVYVLEENVPNGGGSSPRVVYSGVGHQITLSNLMPRTTFTYTLRGGEAGEAHAGASDGGGSVDMKYKTSASFTTKADPTSDYVRTSPFVWDKKKCRSGSLVFSDDGLSVSFNGNEAAYLFVGVASRRANLESFLGADEHSWGFIGDGALYYQRNRVKTYGEPFGEGDVLGMDLDCDLGTLSYSKNGVSLGVAFDNVVGELYPAIAFYTRHQKLSLVPSGFNCKVGLKLHGSPTESTVDEYLDCCAVMEAMTQSTKLPRRLLQAAYDGYVTWWRETRCRVMTRAGYELLFDVSDGACVPVGFKAKDKVKTPRGNGTVVGVADGRLWVETDGETGAVWFFHPSKVRLRGGATSPVAPPAAPADPSDPSLSLEAFTRLVDCDQWTLAQDAKLIQLLNVECATSRASPWNIGHAKVRELVASAPHVEAAVGRFGVLKMLNHLVSRSMPFFDLTWHYFNPKRSPGGGSALLSATRACLFTSFKHSVLDTLLEKTLTHPKKAEDDYDYPEDLPQVTVNRPKAAVARFKLELDTVVSQSLFGQAFDELHFLDNKVLRMWNKGASHHPVDNTALFHEMYHFLGQMLGILLRTRVLVRLDLCTAIWKQLVGVPLDSSDLAEVDTAAHTLLQQLEHLDAADTTLHDLDLTFTTHLSDGTLVALKPGGHVIKVTQANVREYIDLVRITRLQESASAIEAIRQGLCTIVPANAVALFTPAELETRMCGRAQVDVPLLQANTEYDEDLSADDPYVMRFWRVLVDMTDDDRCAFVRFVSARSRLPQDQLSFGQKFKIQSASGEGMTHNPDDSLPKSHTCFFALLLPKYSTDDVCRKQFLYAIHNCLEMDGDFRLADTEMTGWSDIHPSDALSI